MSSRSKAWLVAATIGAVEASKDQLGLCRWNYMIRSVNQRIRNNVRSATQANRFSSSSTTVVASCKDGDTAKKAEESLRTVMYLSCWGPNWWWWIKDWIQQVVSNIYVAEFTIESPRTLDRRKLRNLKSTLGVLAFWWVVFECTWLNCRGKNGNCTKCRWI